MRTTKPRITTRTNPAGSESFCVDAGVFNGKRYRRFFQTKHDAETHAKQIHQAKRHQGALAFSLTPEQTVEAARAFERIITTGGSLTDAVDFYLKHTKPRNGQKLMREVAHEFLQIKTRNGFKPRYIRGLTFFYNKVTETFGEQNIGEIARAKLEEWIHFQEVSPLTKCGYIRDLNMVWRFGARGRRPQSGPGPVGTVLSRVPELPVGWGVHLGTKSASESCYVCPGTGAFSGGTGAAFNPDRPCNLAHSLHQERAVADYTKIELGRCVGHLGTSCNLLAGGRRRNLCRAGSGRLGRIASTRSAAGVGSAGEMFPK